MMGGSYYSNCYKMMWNVNDSIMAHTVGCAKDSHTTDYLSRLGRDEVDVCRESLGTKSVNYIDPEEETILRVTFLGGKFSFKVMRPRWLWQFYPNQLFKVPGSPSWDESWTLVLSWDARCCLLLRVAQQREYDPNNAWFPCGQWAVPSSAPCLISLLFLVPCPARSGCMDSVFTVVSQENREGGKKGWWVSCACNRLVNCCFLVGEFFSSVQGRSWVKSVKLLNSSHKKHTSSFWEVRYATARWPDISQL